MSKIIVRIFKDYEYPKSMLGTGYPKDDAIDKAFEDVRNDMQEVVKNDFRNIGLDFFNVRTIDIKKWKLRNTVKQDLKNLTKDCVPISLVVNKLTEFVMEQKYGKLDPETNPKLFTTIPAVKGKNGIIRPETYTLRTEIETEFNSMQLQITDILRTIKNETKSEGHIDNIIDLYDEEDDEL